MDEDFLLESETAKRLYNEYAKSMPVIDYHCHINPEEIATDNRYASITDVWLGGDHYKWRLMRANGIPESEVTGCLKSEPYTVFKHFAQTLPKAIGNPVYHWTHLELKRYFNITEQLSEKNAEEIYNRCNEKLLNLSARGIIKHSNVVLICTTDDPCDDLQWHKKIASDESCTVKVLPAFRPDKALNADKDGYAQYIKKLEEACGYNINDFVSLCHALSDRIDYFHNIGCRAADHGLDYIMFNAASESKLNEIVAKALNGKESITKIEADCLRTALLISLAKKYANKGWVMQIHFGCMRNNNSLQFSRLGADTGFDAIRSDSQTYLLSPLLDTMHKNNGLPRMILYSLNPADNESIMTIAGCFMDNAECPGKIQLGVPWWFNDTKSGMEKQMLDLCNSGLIGNFLGMLTDSRSFLSYPRHEYFRRIMCNFIGNLVESGQYPADFEMLGQIVKDICYNNVVKFFGFDLPIIN